MEYEELAAKDGWVPKEEYKGNPDKWKTAEQFVKDGETILPIVRSKLKKVEEQNESLAKSVDETKKTVEEFRDYHKKAVAKAEREAYQRALDDLKKKQRDAVEAGDTETFDKIDAQINVLQKPEQPANEPPEYRPWVEKNRWYVEDQTMAKYAESISTFIHASNPGIQPGAFYDKVTDEVKKRFPEKFESKKQSPDVEGSQAPASKKGGRKFSDLPDEDKRHCDRFVSQGLLTKEEFLKDYEWGE